MPKVTYSLIIEYDFLDDLNDVEVEIDKFIGHLEDFYDITAEIFPKPPCDPGIPTTSQRL